MRELSRRKLDWLLRARGPDLSAWPERERLAALDLLRRSPDARQALADALVCDEIPEIDPETDGAAMCRMQAALRRRLAPLSPLLQGVGATALLACMAAGVYLAMVQLDQDAPPDPFVSAQTVSLAALDQ